MSTLAALETRVTEILKLDSTRVCDELLALASTRRGAESPDRRTIVAVYGAAMLRPTQEHAQLLIEMLGLNCPAHVSSNGSGDETHSNGGDDDDHDGRVTDGKLKRRSADAAVPAPAPAAAPREVACPVCGDMFPSTAVFEFFCGRDQPVTEKHIVCFGCASNHLRAQMDGPSTVKCFAPKCAHEVLLDEVALICGKGNYGVGVRDELYLRFDTRLRDGVIARHTSEYARCPGADCNGLVARSAPGAAECAQCPVVTCGLKFCTNCVDVYHYRTTCHERVTLRHEWLRWQAEGRGAYWRENAEMAAKAAVEANKERHRIEELRSAEKRDEEWKEANCRHCPRCERVVDKLSGCSTMICGQDAHGGNIQHGCGAKFNWDNAKRYQVVTVGEHLPIIAASEAQKHRHEHEVCGHCGNDVVGLRFECVNCPTYSLCERCEVNFADHIKGHYFRIHQH